MQLGSLMRTGAFGVAAVLSFHSWADTSLASKPAEFMPRAAQTTVLSVSAVGDGFIAVGDRGHILKSADGKSWKQKPSPVSAMLNKVKFLDEQRGWAVGHDAVILHSKNGGESWEVQYRDPEWGKPMYDIKMLDATRGYAVGANSRLLYTQDGGNQWEILEPDFTVHGLNLYGIEQLADGTLVISGEKGLLAIQTATGSSWEQSSAPYSGSFFGLAAKGQSGAWFYGLRGTVYSVSNVAALQKIDSFEWDEFAIETIADQTRLDALGWQLHQNDLKESLFGGFTSADGTTLVGVNGALVRSAGAVMQALQPVVEWTISDARPAGDGLILAGVGGLHFVQGGLQ